MNGGSHRHITPSTNNVLHTRTVSFFPILQKKKNIEIVYLSVKHERLVDASLEKNRPMIQVTYS